MLAEVFSRSPFAPGVIGQGVRDQIRMAFKQRGFLHLEPVLRRRRAFPMDEVGGLAQVLLGRMPIHHLDTVIKVLTCQVPDPRRAIPDHHGVGGLASASRLGFSPQLLAEHFRSPKAPK